MPPSHIVAQLRTLRSCCIPRPYHSYVAPSPPAFNSTETAILSAALRHVPNHGFSHTSLSLGARDAGYLDVSTNLFPAGPYEIVKYHLVTQRLGLKERVQWPSEGDKPPGEGLGIGRKVRTLVWERLRGNVDSSILGRWQEALALMMQPTHVPSSLSELAKLSDEIWFLAGDTAVDTSWYTKRASLSAVYASTEVFMTQDTSAGFEETAKFLDARLEEVVKLGSTFRDAGEWLGFTGHSVVNVLRSKGVRI